jgi:transmembrane sensor
MSEQASRDEGLFTEAMELVIARAAGASDAGKAAEAWCGGDADRRRILAEAEQVWRLSGELAPTSKANWPVRGRPAAQRTSRRRIVMTGMTALAAALLLAAIVPDGLHWLRGDMVSRTAEIRTLDLADGSRVTLAPDSVVRVAYTPERRSVELVCGAAFFEVKPDTARPFTVDAGGLVARAVGTAYEVERVAARRTVAVAKGVVAVSRPSEAEERLEAGDWLRVSETKNIAAERGHRAGENVAPWRDHLIVLNRRSIREAAAEIGRWYAGRIIVWDDGIGDKLVSGVFDVSDPQTALQALVEPHGGRTRAIGSWLLMVTAGS